jgi:NTE family protein
MIGFLQSILKVKSFEELHIPLAVTATDLSTGEGVVFHSGPLVEPVRASCAYPGMFLPVNIRGRWLVDGMLAHAVPTRPLVEMGAKRVLAVHLKGRWSNGTAPRHLFDVIGQCFAIAQDMCASHWKEAADLTIEPDVNGFEYDAFVHTTALIKAGETATRAAVPVLRKWIQQTDATTQAKAARTLIQAATMPAD